MSLRVPLFGLALLGTKWADSVVNPHIKTLDMVGLSTVTALVGFRKVVLASHKPMRLRAWIHAGISEDILHTWETPVARQASDLIWMVAHSGLAVGAWAMCRGHNLICIRCHHRVRESIRLAVWVSCLCSMARYYLLLSTGGMMYTTLGYY